jgi:hypothetical protein
VTPELLWLPAPAACLRCGQPAQTVGYCDSHRSTAYRSGRTQPRTPDPVRYLWWIDPGRRNSERVPRLALHVTQGGGP